jgi:cysteine-rich repeat protein
MRRLGVHFIVLFLALAPVSAASPPPAPTDPLIIGVAPFEAQQGQQVVIYGVNFGASPAVTFNGTSTTVIGYRPDLFALIVTIPTGASSGPLIVTNTNTTDASNPAQFTVMPGTYTPTCVINGTLTDPTMVAVADAVAVAVDPVTDEFVAFDLSDMSGGYSLALPTSGFYFVGFVPPIGAPFVEAFGSVSCPSTFDHQFVSGSEVSGTVRSDQSPFDPIPNASVELIDEIGDFYVETLTDAAGDFSIYVPDSSYELIVTGPVGGRYIFQDVTGIPVSGNTPLGNIDLASGLLLSGVAHWRDGADSGPQYDEDVGLFDPLGSVGGISYTIADGRFWIPAPANPSYLAFVSGGVDVLNLVVQSIDLSTDTDLQDPLVVYTIESQAPELPTISEIDYRTVQENQPFTLSAVNLAGSSVQVRFSDGGGGWVDGVDTYVEAVRGVAITKVPNGASSTGPVHVRVDGVESAGQPINVVPGVFDPGSSTISGVVTDGTIPVAGVVVVAGLPGCPSELLVDYAITDAGGNYTVNHAGGDYFLYLLPPIPSGFTPMAVNLPGLTGNQTVDVTLPAGNRIDIRIVDSGVGPVGLVDVPVGNATIGAEGLSVEFDDEALTDGAGQGPIYVPSGLHEFWADGPFQSRYLSTGTTESISGDLDFGDVSMDSGYFIEGRVVDTGGVGIAGVEVRVDDSFGFFEVALTTTVDETGRFRVAVPGGTYSVSFEAPTGDDYYIPRIDGIEVWTDTLLHPPVQAEAAGHIAGTVYLADGTTPVPEMPVSASLASTDDWIATTGTCDDGTYDLRVPAATYTVKAESSFASDCLAEEYFNDTYYLCDATAIAVSPPATMSGIDFTLDPAGDLSGRIQDDFGSGVTNALVCVDEGPASPPCDLSCAQTDFNGDYFLPAIPVGSGYRVRVDSASYPTECWNDHPMCLDYDPVPVNECGNTSGLDAKLSYAVGPVPDDAFVAGMPMTASYDAGAGLLSIDWQPTCSASGHVLYFGDLGNFGTYTQANCDIGNSGSVTLSPPAGDLYWIIAGTNGSREGSYGYDGDGFERAATGGPLCGFSQDLSATCLPTTTVCGNNFREGTEACDGTDLAGLSCESFGYDAGTLACSFTCNAFDLSGCLVLCGNGVPDPGEECDDGNDFPGDGCQPDCLLPICGDGYLDILGDQQEQVTNGGFENWSGGVPVDWTLFSTGGTATQDTTHARSGSSSIVIERTTTGTLGASHTMSDLKPGRLYELTVWARVGVGDPTAGFPRIRFRNVRTNEYLDPAGNWGATTDLFSGGVATDGTWTSYVFRFRTETYHLASDTYRVLLLHPGTSATGSKVYHDDVSLLGPLDEQCDDGNNVGGDGCEATCLLP